MLGDVRAKCSNRARNLSSSHGGFRPSGLILLQLSRNSLGQRLTGETVVHCVTVKVSTTALQIIFTVVWQSALGAIASAPPHHIKYAAKMRTQRSAGGAGGGRRYRTPVLSFASPAVAVRPRIGAVRAVPRICGFSLGPPRIPGLVRNTWPDFPPALYSRFFSFHYA